MSLFVTTFQAISAGRGNFSGQINRFEGALLTNVKRQFLPNSCATFDRQPSIGNYANRQYMVGGHSSTLVIDEMFRVSRQGMPTPVQKPTVSAGAGTTPQIGYLRTYDEVTRERSPLSDGREFTGNTTRAWTLLPTEFPSETVIVEGLSTIAAGVVTNGLNYGDLRPGDRIAKTSDLTRWGRIRSITGDGSMTIDDTAIAGVSVPITARTVSRVSHIELWLAVNGGLPRFVMRVRIGTTSVSETTATLALGEAEVESFITMPNGTLNVMYGDRQIIAGVEEHRDTVYLSLIGFPERWGGLQFVTPYNEPIVGMFRFRDYVVLLCPESMYRLQGYVDEDYSRTVLEARVGGIGHHTNAVCRDYALIESQHGTLLFNGACHPAIPKRRTEVINRYLSNIAAYESGFAAANPNDETYQFFPKAAYLNETILHGYVGHYGEVGPEAGGALFPPEWTDDKNYTPTGTLTICGYFKFAGEKVGRFYRGDSVGFIYYDDPRGLEPLHATVTPEVAFHWVPSGDYGGQEGEGKEISELWSYVESEASAWRLIVWPGDERAFPVYQINPPTPIRVPRQQWIDDVAASAKVENIIVEGDEYTATWAPKIVHIHKPTNCAGRQFTFHYQFYTPLNAKLYGVGGKYVPGEVSRKVLGLQGIEG